VTSRLYINPGCSGTVDDRPGLREEDDTRFNRAGCRHLIVMAKLNDIDAPKPDPPTSLPASKAIL
jgi:hypothetical protein